MRHTISIEYAHTVLSESIVVRRAYKPSSPPIKKAKAKLGISKSL